MKDHAQLQRSHRRKFLQRCDLRFLYGKLQIFTGGFDAHSYRVQRGNKQHSAAVQKTMDEMERELDTLTREARKVIIIVSLYSIHHALCYMIQLLDVCVGTRCSNKSYFL